MRPNVVSVQPSSLIFLVIIAVWAAYFVQHWVRRREHLATARAVDQFSDSMRVLDRRATAPSAAATQDRSYAVSPARPSRSQSVDAPVAPVPARETASPASSAAGPSRPGSARRLRGLAVLAGLVALVVVGSLVAFSKLSPALLAAPLVGLGLALAWARSSARVEQHARRAATRRASAPAAASHRAEPVATRTVAPARDQRDAAAEPADTAPAEPDEQPEPDIAARSELFDVQAAEATSAPEPTPAPVPAAALPVAPLVDEDDIPLTWDPVPVPRPTYTMKSRAVRPASTAADLVGDADTEYAAYEDAPQRRVAGA